LFSAFLSTKFYTADRVVFVLFCFFNVKSWSQQFLLNNLQWSPIIYWGLPTQQPIPFPHFLSGAHFCSCILYLNMYLRRRPLTAMRWTKIGLASEWFRTRCGVYFWPQRHEEPDVGLLRKIFPCWLRRHEETSKQVSHSLYHCMMRRASLRINHHTKNAKNLDP
jgi:hypothetical protein